MKAAPAAPAPSVKVVAQSQSVPPTMRPPQAASGAKPGDARARSDERNASAAPAISGAPATQGGALSRASPPVPAAQSPEQRGKSEQRERPVAPPQVAMPAPAAPPQVALPAPTTQPPQQRGRSEERGKGEHRGQPVASPPAPPQPQMAPQQAAPRVPAQPAAQPQVAMPQTTPPPPSAQPPEQRVRSEQRGSGEQRGQSVTPAPSPRATGSAANGDGPTVARRWAGTGRTATGTTGEARVRPGRKAIRTTSACCCG